MAGRLNPAPLILEHDIAAQYQVSKTPAREALNRLADEGILIKYPRKGYVLNKLTDKQFQMLLETRYMLLEFTVGSADQESMGAPNHRKPAHALLLLLRQCIQVSYRRFCRNASKSSANH